MFEAGQLRHVAMQSLQTELNVEDGRPHDRSIMIVYMFVVVCDHHRMLQNFYNTPGEFTTFCGFTFNRIIHSTPGEFTTFCGSFIQQNYS